MFCNNCGNQVPEGYAFCPICGNASLSAQTAVSTESKVKKSRAGLILGIISGVLILACIAVLALGFMGVGSPSSSPEEGYSSPTKAAKALIHALLDGDGEAAYEIMTDAMMKYQGEYTEDEFEDRVDELVDDIDEDFGEGWSYTITSAEIIFEASAEDVERVNESLSEISDVTVTEGNIVSCDIEYTMSDGSTETETLRISAFKIDGRWYACIDI
ncbi:MAG: hypothetical protein IJ457_07515 [Clostridia bacterium]|nr:hypothetical protein [Clostridia bacterium]